MMRAPSRRGFIRGLFSALAAPAVVRAELLMPISALHIPSDIEIHRYGVLPTQWSYEELAEVTRRAFVPRLVVQIYKATPVPSGFTLAGMPIYMDQPVNKLVDN